MTTFDAMQCTSGQSIAQLSPMHMPMRHEPCGVGLHEMVVPGSSVTAKVCPACDLLPYDGRRVHEDQEELFPEDE